MMQSIKYPLTNNAKSEAIRLVQAWNNNIIDQFFTLYDHTAGHARNVELKIGLGGGTDFKCPSFGVLSELAQYKLIRLKYLLKKERYEVTLLQELRNAVSSDFIVSEFFLTTTAVGTLIYGNLDMQEGAKFQSAATNIGNISQDMTSLTSDLRTHLGVEFLNSQPNVASAIDELEAAPISIRKQKLAQVILELGRSMEHIANAGTIMMVVEWLSRFF